MTFAQHAKTWSAQIRAPFLLLAIVLTCIGGAVARHNGHFDGARFLLCLIGVTAAHIAVNLFNELSDYRTGIDLRTRRTPFSGGSGSLISGATSWRAVSRVAVAAMTVACLIGVYLTIKAGPLIAVFTVVGAATIILYTPLLARWGLGETAAGLCLGSLVVAGTYYALAGSLTSSVLVLSVPPGILIALLLLVNEFPDVEADRLGGRKHLVIRFGLRGAASIYCIAVMVLYLVIVAAVVLKLFPRPLLLACLTAPLSLKIASDAFRTRGEPDAMAPLLGKNVAFVLGTDALLALGFLL